MSYYKPTKRFLFIHTAQLLVAIASVFVYVIFVYSSMDSRPIMQIILLVFYLFFIAWFFRIRNSWVYAEQMLVVNCQSNMVGRFFVSVELRGDKIYKQSFQYPKELKIEINGLVVELHPFIGGNAVTECSVEYSGVRLVPSRA
ncbi:hypothetical protein [Teredinibacter turnerae]|uniref:hypothetical protein n=1 Tax=Teredinibacter turnerae TaxID=2426 RepID=UPI00048EA514|nr:hypothetical protein [Teredinibacter turnerae]